MRDSERSYSAPRTIAAVLIFALCCLLSSVRLIREAPNLFRLRADDISSRSDERFAALKSALPPRGVVGYIGESGNLGTEDYYLAQYSLAPLVVERSKNHPLVIVSISGEPPRPDTRGLEFVRNFGNGVLLFSNKDAK
jgi:hypothetical protein